MWIPALVFTSGLILFFMAVFFLSPNMTPDQRRISLLLFPLLAGFSAFFLGGTALLQLQTEISTGFKLGFSATAGIAIFALCYVYPPHFLRIRSDAMSIQDQVDNTNKLLKEDVAPGEDVLTQRKKLATELYQNCKCWSEVLIETFDKSVVRWNKEGRDEAVREIEKQQNDFMKLDYQSLQENGPLLGFLREDARFIAFADACSRFYASALDVKSIAYGSIEESPNRFVSLNDVGIVHMVNLWKREVERMLREVTTQYHHVKTIVG